MFQFQYYYMLLNRKEREVYDAINRSLQNENLVIHTSLQGISGDRLKEIITAVQNDHPELAFANWSISFSEDMIHFKTPVVNVYKNRTYVLSLERIQKKITQLSTEYEKEKFIHDYIVQNIYFDRNEITSNCFLTDNHTVEGPLKNGKAVCEGIARYAQLLCLMAGLKAILVVGTSRSFAEDEPGGHAWVIVCVEGNYYHLDVSHDICLTTDKSSVKYNYFNLTDREILYDHTLDCPQKLRNLTCNSIKHNYFYQHDRFFLQPFEIYQKTLYFLRNLSSNPKNNTFLFRASLNITEEDVMKYVQKAMIKYYDETGISLGYSCGESELQNVYYFTFKS